MRNLSVPVTLSAAGRPLFPSLRTEGECEGKKTDGSILSWTFKSGIDPRA